jgi:hypothetical protein
MDTKELTEVLVVKYLRIWEQTKLRTISIEADTYNAMFSFLPPRNIVTAGDKILFYIVDKEEALTQSKAHYRLFNGTS